MQLYAIKQLLFNVRIRKENKYRPEISFYLNGLLVDNNWHLNDVFFSEIIELLHLNKRQKLRNLDFADSTIYSIL